MAMQPPHAHEAADLPEPLRALVPAMVNAPAAARGLVEAWCDRGGLVLAHPRRAMVVVSELATNVVLHAGTTAPFQLGAAVQDDLVVVEVRDRGRGLTAAAARASPGLGKGLEIVRAWSAQCAISSTPAGTTVVVAFELAATG